MKVAEVFFNEPSRPHYLLEISRKSRLAHTSTKQHLQALLKLSIIKEIKEKKGKRVFPVYNANFEGSSYRFYKSIHNRISLEESGFIEHLKEKVMPDSIVLFGSYANGEDSEESDIDLFIGSKRTETSPEKFEKKLKRKISLHFNEDFKRYPKELKNNIINGITISGYLEAC